MGNQHRGQSLHLYEHAEGVKETKAVNGQVSRIAVTSVVGSRDCVSSCAAPSRFSRKKQQFEEGTLKMLSPQLELSV